MFRIKQDLEAEKDTLISEMFYMSSVDPRGENEPLMLLYNQYRVRVEEINKILQALKTGNHQDL